jgi:putative ABC transport system permease protein
LPKYSSQNPVVFATDKEAMIAKLKDNGLAGKDVYRVLYRAHYAQNFSVRRYIFSLVIFAASLFFIYFLMRSSLIRRVYEVGVYRALGIKKSNVYRLFFSEIVVLTLATSTFGVLATTYIVNRINALAKPIELIYFPWHIPPLSMIFIFLVNTVTGMLPVFSLLRKTPAQILSKYDI